MNLYSHIVALLCFSIFTVACVPIAPQSPNDSPPPASSEAESSSDGLADVEQQMVEQAKATVETAVSVAATELTLVELVATEWPDSSLGCPKADEMYMQVITPGYQITLEDAAGTRYAVHAGGGPDGQMILCTEEEEAMADDAMAAEAMDTVKLTGTLWQWQTDQLEDSANYTVAFSEDGRLAIQADCNRGMAGYTTFGTNGLQIEAPAMTRAACPPGSLDTAFIEQVVASSSYEFDGENLVLYPIVAPGKMTFTPVGAGEMESQTTELSGTLTGIVMYRQRIALPEGSVIEVSLQDVSRADAPALILATQTITTAGENVPIPFTLTYDPTQIDPRFEYSVHAQIIVEGNLRWTTVERHGVLTRGYPTADVEVIVQPVR